MVPTKSPDLKGQIRQANGTSSGTEMHLFRLYLADQTINSIRAKTNLKFICQEYLQGHYQIEEVDILQEPLRCLSDGVLMTPMLIRLSPLPVLTILGDLSDTMSILLALGLESGVK
ncbi:MAG: hypothetical protein RLZZ419_894 [Pseudomonadota bacterium]